MNSLSWMLYGIDVVSNASFLLGCVFGLSSLAMIGVSACVLAEEVPSKLLTWWLLPLFVGFILVFLPSKNTMYAIAVSEIGEKVVESEVGQKAKEALLIWIDKQLDEKEETK